MVRCIAAFAVTYGHVESTAIGIVAEALVPEFWKVTSWHGNRAKGRGEVVRVVCANESAAIESGRKTSGREA
jgi:hypothetical protein